MTFTVNPGEYLLSNSAWQPDDTRRFADRGCDAVYLSFDSAVGRSLDLAFLRDLPGLERVSIVGPMRDDSAVFEVPQLRGLRLLTGSKKPLAVERTPLLDALVVGERPGLEGIEVLTRLETLIVDPFRGSDLTFLAAASALRSFRVDGRYGALALRGIEGAPGLRQLELIDVNVASLEALPALPALRVLVVPNVRMTDPLSLEPIAELVELEDLRVGPVRSVTPLAALSKLRRVNVSAVADDTCAR
ncbi:hypothetical protein ACQP00_29655 [Dactylosporangium sp. CS-047395]|uniref:hypothetical protein n=1 Tax=Dactylosporangium sp. CS-047395 TaxID=3239936 RepID=UPI003D8D1A07